MSVVTARADVRRTVALLGDLGVAAEDDRDTEEEICRVVGELSSRDVAGKARGNTWSELANLCGGERSGAQRQDTHPWRDWSFERLNWNGDVGSAMLANNEEVAVDDALVRVEGIKGFNTKFKPAP